MKLHELLLKKYLPYFKFLNELKAIISSMHSIFFYAYLFKKVKKTFCLYFLVSLWFIHHFISKNIKFFTFLHTNTKLSLISEKNAQKKSRIKLVLLTCQNDRSPLTSFPNHFSIEIISWSNTSKPNDKIVFFFLIAH